MAIPPLTVDRSTEYNAVGVVDWPTVRSTSEIIIWFPGAGGGERNRIVLIRAGRIALSDCQHSRQAVVHRRIIHRVDGQGGRAKALVSTPGSKVPPLSFTVKWKDVLPFQLAPGWKVTMPPVTSAQGTSAPRCCNRNSVIE